MNVHTEVFSVHNITRRKREREKDGERRQRQRETRERDRERRQEKDETREDETEKERRDKTTQEKTTQDKRQMTRGETRQEKRKWRDRDERRDDFFQKNSRPSNPPDELAQNVSKKNPRRTNYSSIFSSKVQNLTVFSIIYMIRIRFFGPVELIQNGFSAAQYAAQENVHGPLSSVGAPHRCTLVGMDGRASIAAVFQIRKTYSANCGRRCGPLDV